LIPMNVVAHLVKTLRDSAIFNPEFQVSPSCILWPDKDRQWEAIIPRLQAELGQLLVLGNYAPGMRTGPAIWLRCAIARTLPDIAIPTDQVPIIYLPGVGRQELRAVDACPDSLKPLAELQYRGVIWSQINAKDWTLLAFLKSDQGGLGLDVAQDGECKQAMLLALDKLLDEDVALLKGKRLDRDFFNTLLTGGDPVRDLLQWIDQSDSFRSGRSQAEWQAFVEVCSSQLGFNPQADGVMVGATRLANRAGPWQAVWARFCEAPARYPGIVQQIKRCVPPSFDLLADTGIAGGWPQWNEAQESDLYNELVSLGALPAHQARRQIVALEARHGSRRELVWAALGESPLAFALLHLAELADVTSRSLAVGSVKDMAALYQQQGWRADNALLHALAQVDKDRDLEAVTMAIRAAYLSWAEDSARHLQAIWNPLQDGVRQGDQPVSTKGQIECILFVDGLRFDCAKRLRLLLENSSLSVNEALVWAALPSVTGTGKYAVAPILNEGGVEEVAAPYDFSPITNNLFKKLLKENDWKVLDRKETASLHKGDVNTNKNTWCEFGDIDHEGHDRGWKLAKHVDGMLVEIHDRVIALLQAGWSRVRVVTDHGWLLLPGGLPKSDLAASLVDTKWGRCAAIKLGAKTSERLFPWYWNSHVEFALANGISCFRAGEEYTHGGLSLQECLNLEFVVTGSGKGVMAAAASFTDVIWKGLRCNVAIAHSEGCDVSGLVIDIRRHAGDENTSIVMSPKALKDGGTASVVVEDEENEGKTVMVVIVDSTGVVITQVETRVGGEA